MGQRLNIEIKRRKDNKVLANSYYHWSAYTSSSLHLAEEIIENIYEVIRKEKVSDEIKAIQLLQTTGAGLMENEYNKLNEEDKKYCSLATNRNLGLISFTDEGMEETRKWEEGRLTIDIDFDDKDYDFYGNKNLVDFEVYFQVDEEEINESYEEEIKSGKLDLNNLTEFEFSLEEMTLNDIRLFMSKLDEIENNNGLFRVKGTDLIYQIIY
ncbi:MAG: hypothetical protein IKC22_00750 [Bacilli bacterium]|nr:hypothetical protein [Bacilli bacterium]MBR2652841.1 hypothetical protein [bacterium]MBR2890911.1 hypothetical protein [Bacilli bacterium]